MAAKPLRVGILGGMGPLAGVELHRLIVAATPAKKDQDHVQVILFTDPSIPDRTTSLLEDKGERFAAAASASVKVLEQAGVDLICMACMTAHSRIAIIQSATKVPIVNGVRLTHDELRRNYPGQKVALLATNGSVKSGIYTMTSSPIDWLVPEADLQDLINDAIYEIKAGRIEYGKTLIGAIILQLKEYGATVFVLGCTELGLLHDALKERGHTVLDPMRIVAEHVISLHKGKAGVVTYKSKVLTTASTKGYISE